MTDNLFSPTYLKELCKKYSLSPSKKYGQNYLISKSVIDKIVEAGELSKSDTVVEIGPGFGVLTLALSPRVKKVISFEIEKKLSPYWEDRQKEFKNIEIIWGNALKEIHNEKFLNKDFKVLANLPYQITSNILRTLLELDNKPERIVVMVQKEVAERMVAKPGDMSLLSLSIQYYGKPKVVAKVPKGNFWPMPKVDSAVVRIDTFKKKEYNKLFFVIARAGFANKRKQLWRNLSEGLNLDKDFVKSALEVVVGNDKVRAEELPVEAWEELVDKFSHRLS